MKFNKLGVKHIANSDDSSKAADGYRFVSEAYLHEDTKKKNILYVNLRMDYEDDFLSKEIAEELPDSLERLDDIKDLYWAASNYFELKLNKGVDPKDLLNFIDREIDIYSKMDRVQIPTEE